MSEVIKVNRLSKLYGSLHVVNSLSLSVEEDTVFGLLRVNGAGKNTTVKRILGTKKADDGHVSTLGMNPHDGCKQLFEHVGVQFQKANYRDKIIVSGLCEATASLHRHAARPEDLLRQFGIWDKTKSLVSSFSGRERQGLFLVLALIPSPEVVFPDELTTGPDARARREAQRILLDLKEKGLTIFLTSRFMDEVEALCGCIYILRKGTAAFYGTVPETLKASSCEKLEDAYLRFTNEGGDYYETI